MTRRKVFILIIGSIFQYFLLVLLSFWLGHNIKFLFAVLIYYIEALYLLSAGRNRKERIISLGLLLWLPLLIDAPIHILSFQQTRLSLPSSIAPIWAVGLGLITFLCNSLRLRLVCFSVFLLISVLFFVTGYDLWLHKINYESYSGRVNETIDDYTLVDIDGRPLLVDSLKGTVAVMDFWNTACEPCFKKLPIFKNKQSDYASKKANILFFTVNCPLQSDSRGLAQSMLQSRGYNFKQYYLQNKGDLKNFKISSFPSVVILADGKRIIYRGDIEGIDGVLNQFLKK